MRRLIRERPSVVGAYALIVIAMFVGFSYLQYLRDADRSEVCHLSAKRWVVTHNEIVRNTEHVSVPDDQVGDLKLAQRVNTRNDQLDAHRLAGLSELGPEPQCASD